MQKYLTFMRLTDKGQTTPPEKVGELYKQMLAITESFGGKTLEVWTTAGEYDFVTIAEFPNDEASFKARIKLNQLGVARLDGGPTYPVDVFLAAAMEKRELVKV
ncbi:MAG TPA: GYD domain-containing protein [Candidatus Dormibacteraeota bacterium]|nr:GYD domain-containing protein [Candidatus Dormibacteraeota bacterium]